MSTAIGGVEQRRPPPAAGDFARDYFILREVE